MTPIRAAARPSPLERLGASLRARLTLAFASIILVTLLLAGAAFVFILRDYQIRRETTRVAELTVPLSNQVRSLEQLGASRQEIVDFLERQADELDLRVVLADARGRVFADTEETLIGRRLDIDGPPRFGLQRRVRQATVDGAEAEIDFMISPNINPQAPNATPPPPGASIGERFLARPSAYLVGLGIPRHSLATAWLELLPRLALAAVGSLLLSIAVAWPLAASIARPLADMTRAAEDLARGRLERQIPVRGRDEVARLAQAFNSMAREVSASQRTLRDFLANVSHDLRTPLTSIRGFSQALTDGTLAERGEVAEAGRVINEEAARMSRLVEDVLYLSKMESGQAPFAKRPLALGPLVAGRVEAIAHRAAETGVAVRWRPEPVRSVLADPTSLERVVDNLLDNALRHTPAGSVVTVELRPAGAGVGERESGSAGAEIASTLLTVHNAGSHIPPDELPRVFERFYQVDTSRAARSGGLGLAIAREVVQAHGGRCWAESSPERGTTFSVLLPAADPAEPGGRSLPRLDDPTVTPRVAVPVGSSHPGEG